MAAFPPRTEREKAMCLVVLVAVIVAVYYFMYPYAQTAERLAQVQTHVDSLDAQNQRAKAELAKGSVNELRAQAARYQRNLAIMRQLVPTGNEVPLLLEQVSTAARRVGLDIGSIQPEPVVAGEHFDTYRYKLGIMGGYHDLAQFLTNVGSLTRIVAPVDLVLKLPSSGMIPQHRKDEAVIQADVDIQTYVARTGPSPGEARTPVKGGR